MQVGHAITTASHGSLGGISIVPVPTGKQIAYLRHSQIIVFLHRYAALPYHLACIIQAHGPQTETKFGITTQLFVKPRLCLGRTECSAISIHHAVVLQHSRQWHKVGWRHFPYHQPHGRQYQLIHYFVKIKNMRATHLHPDRRNRHVRLLPAATEGTYAQHSRMWAASASAAWSMATSGTSLAAEMLLFDSKL